MSSPIAFNRTRHARWRVACLLAWFAAFLVAGLVNPVLAARSQGPGFDLRSWCATPGMGGAASVLASVDLAASTGSSDEPADPAPALAHDLLKCPACWNPMAPPSDLPAVVLHAPADSQPIEATPAVVLHELAPGFEPARGPPQA